MLDNFLKENVDKKNKYEVINRMEDSGHNILVRTFFNQFFLPTNNKQKTLVIKGVSNSGKT